MSTTPPADTTLTLTQEQLDRFAQYIADKHIVIADTHQSVRSSLSKFISEMGAKHNRIHLTSSFNEAVETVRKVAPQVIITEYHLEERFGLELLQAHRDAQPNLADRLFILVTGNSTESAVAEAAEEDVDAYILKPFTAASIRYYLVRAGLAKITPNGYRSELNRGRQLMEQEHFEEALKIFSKALKLDESPSLACYYLGQSYEKLGMPDLTEQSYKNGLIYNEIHYKCSIALFDFYVAQGKSSEAYRVMKKISQHFPVSSSRLSKTIELAVRTHNFDDIAHYYNDFNNLEERREDLRKYVCAALVVGATFQLRHGQREQGLDLLQKAGITASGNPRILREIVTTLVHFNFPEQAAGFLKRFPAAAQKDADYLVSEYAILNLTGKIEDIIYQGRKLLRDGVQDPLLHRIMIRREFEYGHVDAAETLATEAISIWPHESESFEKLLLRPLAPAP